MLKCSPHRLNITENDKNVLSQSKFIVEKVLVLCINLHKLIAKAIAYYTDLQSSVDKSNR